LREQVTQSFERWKMISGDHERRDFSLSYRPQIGARLAGPPAATGEPDLGFDVGWQRSRRRPRKRCCPQKLVEDLASRVEAIGEELVRQLLEALDPIVSTCDRIQRRLDDGQRPKQIGPLTGSYQRAKSAVGEADKVGGRRQERQQVARVVLEVL